MARRRRRGSGGAAAAEPPPRRTRTQQAERVVGPRFGARALRRITRLARQHPAALALGLAALHVALALLTFEPRPHTGGDNGAYITLATSLLERGTYTELWDPAQPPHTKYPPVFPAVLALALAVGLAPWVQLKLVVLAFSASAVAFTFLWLRARRRAALGVGIALLLALAPGVLREGRWVLSDVPFWAFTMVALWAFERLRPDDWRRFAIGVAAVVLAYFTRSAGLPLVLAALAWLGWRRLWRHAVILALVVGVPAVLWWLRTRAFGPSGYVSEFWLVDPYVPALGTIGAADLLTRIGANVTKYVSIHLPVLLSGARGGLMLPVSLAIFGLAFFGWLRRLRRPRTSELFVLFYLGLILVWPAVWSGERFLLPLLPLLLVLAGEALVALMRRVAPRQDLAAVAALGVVILLLALPNLLQAARTGMHCTGRYLAGEQFPCLGSPVYDDFFRMSTQMGEALADDAVVLNRKPRLFHVLSDGLASAIYPFSDDPAVFFEAAREAGARFVLFDRLDGVSELYLRPIIARKARAFCLMWGSDATGTALFGLLPGADTVPDLTAEDVASGMIAFPLCEDDYWRSPAERRRFQPG